jgi:hypothetical protein
MSCRSLAKQGISHSVPPTAAFLDLSGGLVGRHGSRSCQRGISDEHRQSSCASRKASRPFITDRARRRVEPSPRRRKVKRLDLLRSEQSMNSTASQVRAMSTARGDDVALISSHRLDERAQGRGLTIETSSRTDWAPPTSRVQRRGCESWMPLTTWVSSVSYHVRERLQVNLMSVGSSSGGRAVAHLAARKRDDLVLAKLWLPALSQGARRPSD